MLNVVIVINFCLTAFYKPDSNESGFFINKCNSHLIQIL